MSVKQLKRYEYLIRYPVTVTTNVVTFMDIPIVNCTSYITKLNFSAIYRRHAKLETYKSCIVQRKFSDN